MRSSGFWLKPRGSSPGHERDRVRPDRLAGRPCGRVNRAQAVMNVAIGVPVEQLLAD
jgi:hypothetical protein